MPFVLDASVTMAWAFDDEAVPYASRVLALLLGDGAQVPGIWPVEVTNAILNGERRRRLQPADTMRFIALLRALPIRVVDTSIDHAMDRVLTLARANNLSAYDASYLELAMQAGLPLATHDERMRVAANEMGVPLV